MKTLAMLSLMLAVVLGGPVLPPGEPPNPVLLEKTQRPLVVDRVPVQGHVEVEDPAPHLRLSSNDEKNKQAVDMKQSQSVVELEVKVEPEVKAQAGEMVEGEVKLQPEVEMEGVFQADQEVKVPDVEKAEVEMVPELESDQEFNVESEVKVELPLNELQEKDEDQMQHEADTDAGTMTEEQHFNTGEELESRDEPVDDELVDDDNMFEEEVSDMEEMPELRGTFLSQDNELELEEGAEGGRRRNWIEGDKNPVESRASSEQAPEGWRNCPGVQLYGKCYQFFRGPKRAEDAEIFCQTLSSRGHLAAISTQYVHRVLMEMMLRQNGAYTRTWVGGLRYLNTGRFVWLDGSHWSYADWLPGEPNHTANVENCVELLPGGNGLFNDFTCWEPQAFICSY
ncbi:proline-, glutamic acid- and leucine-rich protein 1 isoform X2 [Parambassis ranga]|uniref:Proline-, glutamic acid- and leucine-rich protein 1 isoform X2 n=1 Tax=Parambassis ranga TaxID=210632 RepID=A0A6P7H484_9TELE|nr:proline-, glutamic acid- and leucine-rich protein 1-like isoform X2 [Parambassis ranga]